MSDDGKEKIFEAIAGKSCKQFIEYEMDEASLLTSISDEIARFSLEANDAKGILKEIENHHGVLEKCSAETYQFSHGTMHEYFAARYFVAKRAELDILKKHYEDEAWQNIIIFMASILDDPTEYLNFLVAKSSMGKFQNYPAFGRRLAHLWLLYKCMAMGVSINPVQRKAICKHLVSSQLEMLRQLHKDGVLPYAARIQNGVRQTIFFYKKGRESLGKILQPYRGLMNEAVLSPVREYSDEAMDAINSISSQSDNNLFNRVGLITCLFVPVANANPQKFLNKMIECSELVAKAEHVKGVIAESIALHLSEHKTLV